jgi:hypothetical protein
VAVVTLSGRVRGATHVGGARLPGALVEDGLAAVAGEALLADADGLVTVTGGDEAADVGGDERAAVLDNDDVLASPAPGFTAVFGAFVLLIILLH